jgi:UMF1 family MFS transporter
MAPRNSFAHAGFLPEHRTALPVASMNLRRFYPLSGFPKQGQLWSWISFDVANQSFTLLINTLLFPIFFSKMIVQNDAIDDRIWALTYGSSMLLTALVSPIAGAAADERAWKKRCLIGSGLMCGILTCGLALIQPGQIWLAVLLYIPANFAFSIGENFLASFLPGLARQDQVGRLSGFSWACAYAAALLLLVLTAASMTMLKLQSTESWRPFFVFAGLWFIAFTIPTMLKLREPRPQQAVHTGRSSVMAGFDRLGESMRGMSKHRDLMILLAASLFYGTGMSVVVFFASKLAEEFGFSQVNLVVFVGVITVSGIFGTILPMFFQDRIGHRKCVIILLLVWLATALGFAGYAYLHELHVAAKTATTFPVWPLWLIGNLLGFGLGSLGSANRAFVGYLAPPDREAETFGLWGLMWKLSAIMTFPFAWAKDTLGTPEALLLLGCFITAGLALTLMIDERRGFAARVS